MPITSGLATQLAFTVQPRTSAEAGAPITVEVTAQDTEGRTVTDFAGDVTLTLGANPAGGALSGTLTGAAVAGVATFSDVSIAKVGTGYQFQAASGTIASALSAPFSITPGPGSQLAFTVHPTTQMAGATISPAVEVTALDQFGNTAIGFTENVTVTIGTNPNGVLLDGTTTAAAVSGVATFSDLSITTLGAGYQLQAASGTLTSSLSTAFTITPAPGSQLAFTVHLTTQMAGATITPAVEVTVQDPFGNTATGFTGNVTVILEPNVWGAALSGTTTVAAVSGVATFSDLDIDTVGDGYTLVATSGSLTQATSNAFRIAPAPATQLIFTVQPRSTTAGVLTPISPAVEVTAQDDFGNTATSFTEDVTVAIGTNPSGGTLSGTLTRAAVDGVAIFDDLSIAVTGSGYTLNASATGLSGATSAAFDIYPNGSVMLVFTVQPPSSAQAGVAITVEVTAQDDFGNIYTNFTEDVTVAIRAGTGTAGATLSGTTTVAAVAGVATFSDLSIDVPGTGYTLWALTMIGGRPFSGISGRFDITAGPATQLTFTVQPTTTTVGVTISPAVEVTAQDDFGNTATSFTGDVTVAIGTNPSGGGVLSGTLTRAAVDGVATFTDLRIDRSGIGYTLAASAMGLAGTTSVAFDINANGSVMLVFTIQPPTSAQAGVAITVAVTAQDPMGNTYTTFTDDVTVTLGANPPGGALAGTTTVAAVAGVATFPDLSIAKVGTGYRLQATSGTIPSPLSTAFSITPAPASQLAFTVQPTTTTVGVTISPAVEVTALDQFGNTATGFAGDVTVAIGTNPTGGTLGGTTTVAAVSGVATFSNLDIDKTGGGYTLVAMSGSLTQATSTAFTIVTAPATQLVFTVQPSTTTAGVTIRPAVEVTARDAAGNTYTNFTGDVTVTLGANPPGGTLAGTTTVAAVSGVATFSNLDIDKAGDGYTLVAASGSATPATSNAFRIDPAPATQLVFTVQPTTGAGGVLIFISPAVEVTAQDDFGNTATSFTGDVTVAIGTNPSGGTLSGTLTRAAVDGVATFADLSIDVRDLGYTLTASATGLSSSPSPCRL
jgi:hypothetical protein